MCLKILPVALILLVNINIFAQSATSTAPVLWQPYKDSEQNISISFPKMPVLHRSVNVCGEEVKKRYVVYAKGVVYGLNIVSKSPLRPNNSCVKKKDFSKNNFSDRLTELKKASKKSNVIKRGRFKVIEQSERGATYWLFNDYNEKRWFELWMLGSDNIDNETLEKFIASLKTNNAEGIEIGEGADGTLGDAVENANAIKANNINSVPLKFAYIDRANYTDLARKNNIQGKVVLKVTFRANGSIENISVLGSLPDGMTEEVLAVVRKMVFIPEKKDGVFQTTTKKIYYHFSLL